MRDMNVPATFSFSISPFSYQQTSKQGTSRQEAPSNLPLKGEAIVRMDKSYPLGEDLGGALSPLSFELLLQRKNEK